MKFRKNFHLAKRYKLPKVELCIEYYPKQYATPKYLLFMREMLKAGWEVKMYEVRVSKYIFCTKDDQIYKVRFSNHKPLYAKEQEEDCDFYVGVSHNQVSTTDEILDKILIPKNITV